jgi:hypothetical protein
MHAVGVEIMTTPSEETRPRLFIVGTLATLALIVLVVWLLFERYSIPWY